MRDQQRFELPDQLVGSNRLYQQSIGAFLLPVVAVDDKLVMMHAFAQLHLRVPRSILAAGHRRGIA